MCSERIDVAVLCETLPKHEVKALLQLVCYSDGKVWKKHSEQVMNRQSDDTCSDYHVNSTSTDYN